MSRVFEALRCAEREVHSEIEPARCASGGGLIVLGGDDDRDSEEPHKAFTSLREWPKIMAAQFEDTRGYLETLIADARRVRDSLETEVKRSRQIIDDCDLEAFRAAGKRIHVELGKDLEGLAQRIFEQAEKRLEEETAAAFERLGQAAGGFEEESSERLRQMAESVTEAAAEAMRKQAADALGMFSQGLVACGSRIVAETQGQVESSQGTLQGDLRGKTSELAREAVAQIGVDVAKVSREALQKHVDQAATQLKEWQDQARGTLEADLKRSLEVFEKHVVDLSSALLAEHSRTMRVWVDDLHERMERATGALGGSSTDPGVVRAPGNK